ncbi:MAG TPA: hypothetical protein VK911_14090 [Vicinamibacterales bacterium]|nr:hypothetical protein [Vicinamibacterales bacterium]
MLIRVLLLIILLVLLGRAIRGVLASAVGGPPPSVRPRPPVAGTGGHMVRDPVCGTYLPPSRALPVPGQNGGTLYFCSEACKAKYIARERRA